MTNPEAQHLARQIGGEPDWHAGTVYNSWTGEWHVRAWQGAIEYDEEGDFYSLHSRHDWYRLRQGLAEEAEEARMPLIRAIVTRCTCAQCGHVWKVKMPASGFLDFRQEHCPKCEHTTFTVEALRFELIRSEGEQSA